MAKCIRRLGLSVILGATATLATPLLAQESAISGGETNDEPAADAKETRRAASRETLVFDHWENGFDLKMTSLFNSSAFSLVSPSLILTAQWNYRWPSETRVGFSFSGMANQQTASQQDGATRTYATYYGGLDVGQAVFAHNEYRLVLDVAAGLGVVFVRLQQPNVNGSTVERPNFAFVEPGAYLTFFEYDDLDIGAAASYRLATLENNVPGVSNSDISSLAVGVTFRALLH